MSKRGRAINRPLAAPGPKPGPLDFRGFRHSRRPISSRENATGWWFDQVAGESGVVRSKSFVAAAARGVSSGHGARTGALLRGRRRGPVRSKRAWLGKTRLPPSGQELRCRIEPLLPECSVHQRTPRSPSGVGLAIQFHQGGDVFEGSLAGLESSIERIPAPEVLEPSAGVGGKRSYATFRW